MLEIELTRIKMCQKKVVTLAKGLVGKIKLKVDMTMKRKLKITIDYTFIKLNEDGYEETSCHHLKVGASSHR